MENIRLPTQLFSSKKALSKRVVISYILDYVIIVVLLITFYALDAVEPFHQHFSLRNYTLQYPYAVHERVPVSLLFVLNTLFPAIIIALYALLIDGLFSHTKEATPRDGHRTLGKYRLKDRLWELNCGLLGLLLSQGATFVITGALKNAAGKPRPDLIDRCQPLPGSADPLPFGLSNSTICTQTNNKILKDGFRSFPSGHSSSAFAGLFYLSIYLTAKMHVLDNRGEVWKTFIVMVPTLGAALIAISRIMDARHHPFDVISGSLLGIVVAWGAYRQYFPPVTESWRKGRAYSIRTWATEPKRPGTEGHGLMVDEVAPERGTAGDPSSNVFRQQIRRSQHERQTDGRQQVDQSSSSSLDLEGNHTRKPMPTARPQMRRVPSGWSSASDQELDVEAFEMQPQHPLPARPTHDQTSQHSAAADPVSDAFGQDTSYHPRVPGNAHSGTVEGNMVEHRPRGVDLVETYR
ncbi:MAG: hypothetical protein Q9194_006665 [Teloschistes cf. exilis]